MKKILFFPFSLIGKLFCGVTNLAFKALCYVAGTIITILGICAVFEAINGVWVSFGILCGMIVAVLLVMFAITLIIGRFLK